MSYSISKADFSAKCTFQMRDLLNSSSKNVVLFSLSLPHAGENAETCHHPDPAIESDQFTTVVGQTSLNQY
jgi:hypothetical protein